MRILFTVVGLAGHVVPLLPFAQRLGDDGHTVAFAGAGPNLDLLRKLGFEA